MSIIHQIRGWCKRIYSSIYERLTLYKRAEARFEAFTGKKFSYNNVSESSDINEKLFWLHRYWQNPLIVQCADKYRVREYIKKCGLENLLVPLLGVYDTPNDIDFEALPEKFVLKCNHGYAYNIICTNKQELDIPATKEKLSDWMNQKFGKTSFELHYLKIKPKIICEQYLDFSLPQNAIDYKVHCLNGTPFCFLLCVDRNYTTGHVDLVSYSTTWSKLDYLKKEAEIIVPKPKYLDQMLEYAKILSSAFPYVRVDFYYINDVIYVGELTFTPATNIMNYYKDSTLNLMGAALKLPPKLKSKF